MFCVCFDFDRLAREIPVVLTSNQNVLQHNLVNQASIKITSLICKSIQVIYDVINSS